MEVAELDCKLFEFISFILQCSIASFIDIIMIEIPFLYIFLPEYAFCLLMESMYMSMSLLF